MADKKISALTGATTPLAGTEVLPIVQSGSTVKVSVDNLTVGKTVKAAAFDTDVAAAKSTLSGTTWAASGTDANINLNVTLKGTSDFNVTNATTSASQAFSGAFSGGTAFRLGQTIPGVANGGWHMYDMTNSAVRMYWTSTGDVGITNGNLIQGTAAKGVNFTANTPAAGMTSQLLNWYEEGTFTPVITAASGTITTYTALGTYVKIGKSITIHMTINIANPGTAAGAVFFASLPFTSENVTGNAYVGRARENNISGSVFDFFVTGNSTSGLIASTVWASNQSYSLAATYITT